MHVLVTGGAGYIGSHTCKALKNAGIVPVTFDNLSLGFAHFVKWGPLVQGDLLDLSAVRAALGAYDIKAVMHFAALTNVGESVHQPHLYYRNNVIGTYNLLEAMREAGVPHLVFSSTCATYGRPQRIPLDESHPQDPISPYGSSKLVIERMLRDYHGAYGLRAVSLRYFNAAGADAAGDVGEAHSPETHLIPLAMAATEPKASPLTVFGDDYPTEDGTCVRDYIHVTDLADAHVAALASLPTQSGVTAYNLGTGTGYSVRQVLECVSEVAKRHVAHVMGPRRPGDPPVLVADTRLATARLSWRATRSSLDEIVRSAWNFKQRQRVPTGEGGR